MYLIHSLNGSLVYKEIVSLAHTLNSSLVYKVRVDGHSNTLHGTLVRVYSWYLDHTLNGCIKIRLEWFTSI